MIDSGFNHNLIQYTKEFKHTNRSNENEEKKSIDPNSFFGSFLSICNESDHLYENNPFFSEMKKYKLSYPLIKYPKIHNNYASFFGAFLNQGSTFAYGIPSLKFRIDPYDESFEAEYKKYLNQYSDYLYQPKTNIIPLVSPSVLLEKPRDIFTQSLFRNGLSDPIYNTSQLIKSQRQFNKQGDDFYSLNQLDETGFVNCYKTLHFEQMLQQSFDNIFYSLDSPIDQMEFYSDLMYLIQGIPSKTFMTGTKFPFTFEFSNHSLRLLATLVPLTKNFFDYFIQFGTKIQLIQYLLRNFLFNQRDLIPYSNNKNNLSSFNIPFVLKRFYEMVNDIIIQVNEKIIYYKTQMSNKQMTLIGLRNKITALYPLINILYSIFNLEHQANNSYNESLQYYFSYYINVNIYQQSHYLINSLINFYYSFHTQSKTYYLIKNLLVNALHSYLFFLIILIFNNNVIDSNNEYFIMKSGNDVNTIALDNSKIPVFLNEYKSVILNNAILLEFIKKKDENYFSVCNYKSDALIDYLDKLNLINYNTEIINEFIKFKEGIFHKKLELMYAVNEKTINALELKKNEERIVRLNKIKLIKDSYRMMEEKEKEYLREIKANKLKYLNDIQSQILNKKQRIDFELQKIKNEQIEQRELEKEKKRMQEEVVQILKMKYEKIRQSTKMIELYGDERQQWKIKRHNNIILRNDLFNAMHDKRGFDNIYPPISESVFMVSNYHLKYLISTPPPMFPSKGIESIDSSNQINESVFSISQQGNQREFININDIDISIAKEAEDYQTKPTDNHDNDYSQIQTDNKVIEEKKIELPKFFIHNMIYNDIVIPLIDTSLEIANEKYKHLIEGNGVINKKTIHFVSKINKEVDMEVVELLNKIPLVLKENKYDARNENGKEDIKIEIPIQIIIQEFFYDVILKQYKITNHCFVQMLKNKYNLIALFDFFNEIFLCNSGDLILRYIETIFDFRTLSFNSSDGNYLSSHLQAEINQKYSNRYPEYVELSKSITFIRLSQMNLNFSISNIDMAFKLLFKCEEPVNFIFTPKLVDFYDTVFKLLLKQFVYNQIIVRTYSVIKNIRKEYSKREDNVLFKKISKLFNECYRTLKVIQTFLYYEIIDHNWKKMKEKVTLSADIYEISSIHFEFIQGISEILVNHPIVKRVNKLYHHCSRFYLKSIIADYFDFNTIKRDEIFLNILDKMKKSNNLIIKYIKEERVIGEFYDLKNYF